MGGREMPIYEYECKACGEVFQALILKVEEEGDLECPRCNGANFRRLISRTFYHVSEAERLANYDPKAQKEDSFYKDSRNIGLHAKWRAKQMGVDLGKGFEEKLDRIRTDPSSVIKESE